MDTHPKLGTRRHWTVTVLSDLGSYPHTQFRYGDVLYCAGPSLVYTATRYEEPNEFGFSEIAWTGIENLRLWGAFAFSLREGLGFFTFYPLYAEGAGHNIYTAELNDALVRRVVERAAGRLPPQHHELRLVDAAFNGEVARLFDALTIAPVPLLRGVNCYLKAHMLWRHHFFMEEMGICLYIALEAGLSVLRRRLSEQAGRDVSFYDVFDFVKANFSYGDALADYWEDAHDDRNALLHPDNDSSPYVIQPMLADDIYELFDPMVSLYRYILIGEPRPQFDERGMPLP